jgi:hypothetical protein
MFWITAVFFAELAWLKLRLSNGIPSSHRGEEEVGYSSTHTQARCWKGVGGQRHAPAAAPPGKGLRRHYTEGWMGIGAVLDGSGKSRPHPHRGSNPLAGRYTEYGIPDRTS